jgi:hypothetical protein
VAAFLPLGWVIARRWPDAVVRASLVVIGLGVALGQGLEPLGEVLAFPVGWEPFTNPVRWRVFLEFLLAGGIAYLVAAVVARARPAT